jgi:UDP-N-acetylglucosamine diphosphorylase/glucosamine-1-phosphate N-acetyltransferase
MDSELPGLFVTLILAAGFGKRMKSDLPKVLHPLAGLPLVHRVIQVARDVGSERTILIIGYKRNLVIDATMGMEVEYAVQERQLGTGDAVNACRDLLTGYDGDVLVLSGDVPLLEAKTIKDAYALHKAAEASATVFTFKPESPAGYGRIIRGSHDEFLRIVEQKDATAEESKIAEVNGGVYFFKCGELFKALKSVGNENAAGEYYITDTIAVLRASECVVAAFLVNDPIELEGVNNPEQLKSLEHEWLKRRKTVDN